MKTIAVTLGRRQTAALAVVSAAAALAAGAVAADSAASFGRLAVWCQELLLSRPASPAAAALAASAAALVAVSAVLAGRALVRELASARALAEGIARSAVRTPGRVAAALSAIGANGLPVAVVADGRRFAYTFGAFRPRIVVSTGLISALSLEELKSVLRHERRHLLSWHPLRSLAWETACRAFFFLPSLRDVADHLALARELDADRDAVQGESGRRTLASALLKATSHGLPPPATAAWSPFGHLHGRIEALAGGGGAQLRLGTRRFAATAAACAVVLCAAASPVMAQAPRTASARCRLAIESETDFSIFSPFALNHPVGPSSTESDLQSKEIVP